MTDLSAPLVDLTTLARAELREEAAVRDDALTAVGFPDSDLWILLEAHACAVCGEACRKPGWAWRGTAGFPYAVCVGCVAKEEPDWFSGNAE